MYKVSQKKWDLLLVIVVVNPTFFGTPCTYKNYFRGVHSVGASHIMISIKAKKNKSVQNTVNDTMLMLHHSLF